MPEKALPAGTTAAIRILLRAHEGYWNKTTPDEDNLYVVHNWAEIGEMLAFFNEHRELVKREYEYESCISEW